jgi:hypothetical protein
MQREIIERELARIQRPLALGDRAKIRRCRASPRRGFVGTQGEAKTASSRIERDPSGPTGEVARTIISNAPIVPAAGVLPPETPGTSEGDFT